MCGSASVFVAAVALYGHAGGVMILADWGGSVDMKSYTAVAVVFAGLSVLACAADRFDRGRHLTASVASAMLVAWLVIAASIWYAVSLEAVGGNPAIPSVMTLACLFIFAAAMVYRVRMTDTGGRCTWSRVAGGTLLAAAWSALIGHAAGVPWMYWYAADYSNGMAIPTAAALASLGVALLVMPGTAHSSLPGTER